MASQSELPVGNRCVGLRFFAWVGKPSWDWPAWLRILIKCSAPRTGIVAPHPPLELVSGSEQSLLQRATSQHLFIIFATNLQDTYSQNLYI